MKYNVILLDDAKQQFIAIRRYITYTLHSPRASERFRQEVHKKLDRLITDPYIYAFAPNSVKYRKMPIKNYIALYYVSETEKTVYITALVFSGSDYITRYIKE